MIDQKAPPHPAVNWLSTKRISGSLLVEVTCPWCKQSRFTDAPDTRRRIKEGTFSGYCYKDRLLTTKRTDRKYPHTAHPQVDWNKKKIIKITSQRLTHVSVTCPKCNESRWQQSGPIASQIAKGKFSGVCLACSGNARKKAWQILGPGRKIDSGKGYIRLTKSAISPDKIWLFDAMLSKTKSNHILEHRFVMAQALGRPLKKNELVDHMDGNKLNNSPQNLRLYIRGANMPGETSAFGTYYSEWQSALSEVFVLRAKVKELEAKLLEK